MAKITERDSSTNEKFQHIPASLKSDKSEKKIFPEIHRNRIEQRISIITVLMTMIAMTVISANMH